MPTNVVKTERDERLWQTAKKMARRRQKKGKGPEDFWAYVMRTFQNMKHRRGNPQED